LKEKQIGLLILRSLFESGVLCVPETVEVKPEHHGTTKVSKIQIPVYQNRFCLTLLHEEELPKHADHFGHFSVAFSTSRARALGAVPVIYFPIWSHGNMPVGLDLIGHTLLRRLIEIQYLLTDLASGGAGSREKDFLLLRNVSEDEKKAFLRILKSLDGIVEPLDDLAGTVRAVLKFFYPTERDQVAQSTSAQLAYYHQREWRVIDGVTVLDTPGDSPLKRYERECLIQLDTQFFTEIITYDDIRKPRVEFCRFIRGAGGQTISDLVDHVTVPAGCFDEARKIALAFGFKGEISSLPEMIAEPQSKADHS